MLRGVCELKKREKKISHLAFLGVSKAHDRCGGKDCDGR